MLVVLAIMLVLASDTLAERPRSRTVLVVRAYPNLDALELPAMMCSNSARDLTKAFARQSWEVTFLETRPMTEPAAPEATLPTFATVMSYFKKLKGRAADDEVVVVLIGHLASLDDADGVSQLYFTPQDANYDDVAKASDLKEKHHALALKDIYGWLQNCPAQRKLLILVTALASGFKASKLPKPYCSTLPALPVSPRGVAVWVACSQSECHIPSGEFLEAIKGHVENAGSSDTLADITPKVSKDVAAAVAKFSGKLAFKQTPQLLGKLPDEWLVHRKEAAPAFALLKAPFTAGAAKKRQEQLAKEVKLAAPFVENAIGMKLALVPPGEFVMGDDGGDPTDQSPPVRVRLPRPMLVGRHEVTQGQYQKLMGTNPSAFKDVKGQDTAAYPVEQVPFKQAILFCNALSERDKLTPYYKLIAAQVDPKTGKTIDFLDYTPTRGPGYRLPTEAEWEYACRAGSETPYHVGDALTGKQANVDAHRPSGVKEGAYLGRPTTVGSYAANAFGLHDMHGNVAEMCEDNYAAGRYKELAAKGTNGSANGSGGGLARGGAWNFPPKDCRATTRLAVPPQVGLKFVGFRVFRDVE